MARGPVQSFTQRVLKGVAQWGMGIGVAVMTVRWAGGWLAWQTCYVLEQFDPTFGQAAHYEILLFFWWVMALLTGAIALVVHGIELLLPGSLPWYWRLSCSLCTGLIAAGLGVRWVEPALIPSLAATAIAPLALVVGIFLVGVELIHWALAVMAVTGGTLMLSRLLVWKLH